MEVICTEGGLEEGRGLVGGTMGFDDPGLGAAGDGDVRTETVGLCISAFPQEIHSIFPGGLLAPQCPHLVSIISPPNHLVPHQVREAQTIVLA